MTTPDEFLERVLATVDELALCLAATPRPKQEEFLDRVEARVRAQWRQCFSRYMAASDVDGMITDLVGRIKSERDRLERFGMGSA